MAKKNLIEGEAVSTIANLPALRREFQKNEMPPKKLLMLKEKLLSLHADSLCSKDESKLLESIIKRARNKSKDVGGTPVPDKELQIINEIEILRCTDKCFVKTETPPQALYFQPGQICDFYKDEETERYVVFIKYNIRPEWQMSRDLVLKEQRGHFASEEDYPKTKEALHRIDINEHFFNQWFQVEEDLLAEKEKEYVF